MSTIDDSIGRLARVYDSATDTWVPLIGAPAPHEHTTASSLSVSGSATVGSTLSVSSSANFSGDISVSGLVSVNEITESIPTTVITSGSASLNFATANNFYIASASANFGVVVTNVPTTEDKVSGISITLVQGATGYIPNAISINGSNQTIRWSGGSAPIPTSTVGDIDIFNFTFIRKSSSWIVLGSSNIDF